jgi:hypothetical protein
MSVFFGSGLSESPIPGQPLAAPNPPIPVVYETSELEKMSARAYAAVHLRVPDSGIEWLDKMIERSRELDAKGG